MSNQHEYSPAFNLSTTLKKCRESNGRVITVTFDDGSSQMIRPTAAFTGDVRGLCEHIAAGRGFKVDSSTK